MCENTTFSTTSNKTKNSTTPTLFNRSDFGNKKVEVSFTQERTSNVGKLLLLNEVNMQIGLINKLAECTNNARNQSYAEHSITSMLCQRVLQIAAGYENANDCNTMRDDGILKICADQEHSLASQPTISRLENLPGARRLYQMAKALVDAFISSYEKAPKVIILDCDDTSALAYD